MTNIAIPSGYDDAPAFASGIQCAARPNGFPLLVTPQQGTSLVKSHDKWRLWLEENMQAIRAELGRFGAIVFRGFTTGGSSGFHKLFSMLPLHEDTYSGGAGPRDVRTERVMTSTRIPPQFKILLHQEMAYAAHYPLQLAFHCVTAPKAGGETILGDMRRMRALLPDSFMKKLDKLGILYRRYFFHPDAIKHPALRVLKDYFRTWDDAFFTDDRAEIERICAGLGDFSWTDDGGLEIKAFGPGSIAHPSCPDGLWFNQIATLHRNDIVLGPLAGALKRLTPNQRGAPNEVMWGDGSVMEIDELRPVYQTLDALTVSLPWEEGDVMLVDNLVSAHGRSPYLGQRDVEVSLFDSVSKK